MLAFATNLLRLMAAVLTTGLGLDCRGRGGIERVAARCSAACSVEPVSRPQQISLSSKRCKEQDSHGVNFMKSVFGAKSASNTEKRSLWGLGIVWTELR